MDHSFDRHIKQKLGNSSPEELGYKPDREQLWKRVEAKKKKKGRPLILGFSHAAAVAAGLLIGFFLLSRDQASKDTPAVAGASVATVTRTIRDTVYVPQVKQQTGPAVVYVAPKDKQPAARQQQQYLPVQQPETTQPVIMPVQQEPVPVMIASRQPKVLHLADMDNENTLSLTPKKKNKTILDNFSNQGQPESNTETLSMLASRKLNLNRN